MKIEIDEDRLVNQIAEGVIRGEWSGQQLDERVESLLAEKIGDELTESLRATLHERVAKMANEAIDAGLQKTDEWGNPTGPPVNLRSLVADYFTQSIRDPSNRYNNRNDTKQPLVAWMIRDLLKEQMSKQLKVEMDRATKEVRGAVDNMVKERLSETLRDALGIGGKRR